jgi:hypothetical protein
VGRRDGQHVRAAGHAELERFEDLATASGRDVTSEQCVDAVRAELDRIRVGAWATNVDRPRKDAGTAELDDHARRDGERLGRLALREALLEAS